MQIRFRELAILVLGDMLFFLTALWVTLLIRYAEMPSREILLLHLEPFLVLIMLWVSVFYIAGLYDKHTLFLKQGLASLILRTQVANIILAALFFFLLPVFSITPKTVLFIYLLVSSLLILWWRFSLVHLFAPRKKYKALLIADGDEAEELIREVNGNSRYDIEFVRMLESGQLAEVHRPEERIASLIAREQISVLIADPHNPSIASFLPVLTELTFLRKGFLFIDFSSLYEELFDRVPLSYLRHDWLLERATRQNNPLYAVLKRTMDVVGALMMMIVLLVLMPFIYVACRLEKTGSVFIAQTRLGRYGIPMTVYKLRTMRHNDSGAWEGETKNNITRVGAFLRKTSIDELPQAWNILKGELSLIGPRSDIIDLGKRLWQELPHYFVRYTITPGITGWAQTHQRYSPGNISPQSIEESRMRLAYDIYYVRRRSFLLDVAIALRTCKTILTRIGLLLSGR